VYNKITITTEKIFHKIESIRKNYYIIQFPWNKYYSGRNISNYYIIKFPWNKYYAGTNISSQLQVTPIYTKHWDIYFYIYSIELILNLQDNCLKQN
jgi:hypothetical protein